MTHPGFSTDHPLRVAIIGAGPAGFYTAEHLFKQKNLTVEIDMFDRLPTPFGLVRAGVAPDHQKIKNVIKVFDRTARHPHFRYFGNVELGKHLSVDDLRRHYHQIVYTIGTRSARKLGIPGEDLRGSHSATEFVGWVNGHPDYRNRQFDLTQERVAVIGVGNVAMDVARMLAKTRDELAVTDIADHALEALSHSRVKEIYILGRRGAAQAAFTIPELKEMGHLTAAQPVVATEELVLDDFSHEMAELDGQTRRKLEMLQSFAEMPPDAAKPKKIIFRFLLSPVELLDDGTGAVRALRVVKNKLVDTGNGVLRPQPTGEFEELPVGLVFRSIGYRGVPLPGVPFHSRWGIIPNEDGRVFDPETEQPRIGEYTAGWIKRGPSGIVGTNKPDAAETVQTMLFDLQQGKHFSPETPDGAAVQLLIAKRQPKFFSYADWQKLDALEIERGRAQGRPRVKFTSIAEMLAAVGK